MLHVDPSTVIAQPDPVFALIEAHRAAYAAWAPLAGAWNDASSTADFDAAKAAQEEPGRVERAALAALVASRPATAAGLWALITYLPGAVRQVSVERDTEQLAALDALREGALSLGLASVQAESRPVSAGHVDPMFGAIERFRLAHDAFGDAIDASDRIAIRKRGGDLSLGAMALADARRDAADAADEQAWREIFAVMPTTIGGLFALLRHLGAYHHSYEGMDAAPDVFAALVKMVQGLTGELHMPVPTTAEVDPHLALLPALRQAFAWTRDAQAYPDHPQTSPEGRAYTAVLKHCRNLADRLVALPAPNTPAGLGALALALCVWGEGSIGYPQDDGLDHERYPEERRIAAAVRGMMSLSGVSPLAEWSGFGDEPDSEARWDAMMARVGEGSLPVWALAGKSGPDPEEAPPGAQHAPKLPPLHPAAAWAGLPQETRDALGTTLVDLVFQDFLSGAAYAEEDRVLTDEDARGAASARSDALLNRIYDDVSAALPALFGPAGENPAWVEDYRARRLTISAEGVLTQGGAR